MPLYEHVMIARPDISASQVSVLAEEFIEILKDRGGSVSKIENWGLRALAYPIKKKRKAYYVLINIDAPHTAIAEMERRMRIREDVLRFLTIRVDTHDEAPSAPMQGKASQETPPGASESATGKKNTDTDVASSGRDNKYAQTP